MSSFLTLVGAVLLLIVVLIAIGFVVMVLWNFVIPAIIPGASALSIWQATALYVLAGLLGGAFTGRRVNLGD